MQYQTHYTIDKKINSQLKQYSLELRNQAYTDCARLLSLEHVNQDTYSSLNYDSLIESQKCLMPPHHQLTSDTLSMAKKNARLRFSKLKTASQLSTVTLNQPRSMLVAKTMAKFLRSQRFIPAKYSSTSYTSLHKSLSIWRRHASNLAVKKCINHSNRRFQLPIMREIICRPNSISENHLRKEIIQSPRRKYHFIGFPQELMRSLEVDKNGIIQNIKKFKHLFPSKIESAQIIGINTAIRLINKETTDVERALALYSILQKHDVNGTKCTMIQLDNLPLIKRVSFTDLNPEISDHIKRYYKNNLFQVEFPND